MPSIGPSMPPQPSKRSRDSGDDRSPSPDTSDKRRRVAGPAPPARTAGPALPPSAASRSSSPDSDAGPAPPSKPARVMGPTAPPAALDQRPPNPLSDDSDSSDDDFGPAPPPAGATYNTDAYAEDRPAPSAFDTDPHFAEAPKKAQRDDWMTMPPTQDDLAARLDPTKQRARKFNSGKGTGAGGGMSSAWTETPQQKLKRLQDEAMGITTSSATTSTGAASGSGSGRSKEDERRARKMREKIDAARGKSLVEQHQSKAKVEEDDPSRRVFDYEKDMAVQGNLNHKQKRDMLSKSKGFGDRFSSGSFL
ncbi:uncharacterized protein EKO05_0002398 [Ascochyta rabiei]|uniref:uncharacterized protein n=1 Tax=Didymella rabiei TaxID=5454 RepID=UPI00190110EA|nr:uncharacterized protein EKO05_0002398 [Ascochyta rabiei]UPX11810.1 hypothetical protein EKO05_0002398 [Ascochyta rabiei]